MTDLALRVGVDMVSIPRVVRLLEDNPTVVTRLLGERERALLGEGVRDAARVAGRLAAKEAVCKALGTGFSNGVQPSQIETLRDEAGRPHVRLHGAAREAADTLGLVDLEVSLSHGVDMAVAFVVGHRVVGANAPELTDGDVAAVMPAGVVAKENGQ